MMPRPAAETSAAGAASWRHSPWYMLAVITAVNAVNWADRQVVPILFPGIRSELALSDTQLGIIGGFAFSLVYAGASFLFGYAADRTIRRNVVAVGLVVWSIATAASGLATGFGSLFAARFFTGAGEASLYPATMSLIAERFPVTRRGRAMGIFGAAARWAVASASGSAAISPKRWAGGRSSSSMVPSGSSSSHSSSASPRRVGTRRTRTDPSLPVA